MPFPNKDTQFKPGQSGNPAGKPKGSKNLTTIVRELEDDDFDWSKLPDTQRDTVKKLGAPWRAIVYVAIQRAIDGDMKAAEWLRKSGYGDKMDITTNGESVNRYAELSSDDLRKLAQAG